MKAITGDPAITPQEAPMTPVLTSSRIRGAAALAAGAVVAGWPVAAYAETSSQPQRGQISLTDQGEDPYTCAAAGITFHYDLTRTIDYTVFFHTDGTPERTIAHNVQQVTLTANGKSLRENDHWTDTFYPDGRVVRVGNDAHVQGATGIVLRDAGRFVLDADHHVFFMAGPHPQFLGGTFCQALLP